MTVLEYRSCPAQFELRKGTGNHTYVLEGYASTFHPYMT